MIYKNWKSQIERLKIYRFQKQHLNTNEKEAEETKERHSKDGKPIGTGNYNLTRKVRKRRFMQTVNCENFYHILGHVGKLKLSIR